MLRLRWWRQVWPPIFAKGRDLRVSSSPRGRQARNWRRWPRSPTRIKFASRLRSKKNRNCEQIKTGLRRKSLKNIAVILLIALFAHSALAQKPARPAPAQVAQEVRDYRMDNEERIVRGLSEFLSIPNIASDTPNIQKNAAHLVEMLEARGIETHLRPITGRGPVVFGKLISAEAKRTVIFYAHYDGQPVDAAAWTAGKPFEPALRDAAIEAGGKRIPFPENSAQQRAIYNNDWRIYARSSSDDKSPIVALLAAIDALHAKKIPLAVNLKVIFEGEEEAGSTNLQRTLELHRNLLGADLLITADGPVHQSGRRLVFFGNRATIAPDIPS